MGEPRAQFPVFVTLCIIPTPVDMYASGLIFNFGYQEWRARYT